MVDELVEMIWEFDMFERMDSEEHNHENFRWSLLVEDDDTENMCVGRLVVVFD